jgi:HAMP domain-containing protein
MEAKEEFMAMARGYLHRAATGATTVLFLGLIALFQWVGIAHAQSPAMGTRTATTEPDTAQPSTSPDPVRKEIEDLRQQVQALRAELRALKSALTSTPAFDLGNSSAPPQRTQQTFNCDPNSPIKEVISSATAAVMAAPSRDTVESHPTQLASLAPPVSVSKAQNDAIGDESHAASSAPSGLRKLMNDRVTLGGYGSMRFEANDVSAGQFIPGGAPNGFTFRRFVLTTDARLTPRLRIHSETEFERLLEIEVEKRAVPEAGGVKFSQETEGNAGGEIAVEQMWGQYDFAENHGLRFGIVLPPLGRFNLLHDDDYWDLPRRTLVDRDAPVIPVPTAWRELGAGLVGSFDLPRSTKLNYQIYVLNGTTLSFDLENVVQTRTPQRNKLEMESEMKLASGAVDGSQGTRALAWRAAFSPTLAGEVALSGYHGRYTPDFLSVREPLSSLGLDWKWQARGFETEGEVIYTSLGRTGRVLEDLAAKAVTSSAETTSSEAAQLETEIELDVKNLARTRFGFWADFKYHWRPGFLRNSFLGRSFEDPRLIPVVRYEHVWLNRFVDGFSFADGSITGLNEQDLSQDRLSLGVNYRPVAQFGMQLTYEHNQRRRGDRLIFPAVPDRSTNGVVAGMTFAF